MGEFKTPFNYLLTTYHVHGLGTWSLVLTKQLLVLQLATRKHE